jgi:hypothetical protein
MFLHIMKPDGTRSLIDLSQASEISVISREECSIKFVDGGVIAVTTVEGVNKVLHILNADAMPR